MAPFRLICAAPLHSTHHPCRSNGSCADGSFLMRPRPRPPSPARPQRMQEEGGGLGGQQYVGVLVQLLRMRQACNHPALVKGAVHHAQELPAPEVRCTLPPAACACCVCPACSLPALARMPRLASLSHPVHPFTCPPPLAARRRQAPRRRRARPPGRGAAPRAAHALRRVRRRPRGSSGQPLQPRVLLAVRGDRAGQRRARHRG